ncbi:U3 small nucleolar RNA-associated protein 14 homolog A [Corythoichthys intestinalis]|uniref:U3 small nucleolar RNA-associated protein 14 homolog A n=1 Tax=Corythoichthys intestinalis TaxID=161448 RepID=UPI0025A5521E|nr:U3 small nucleolar RNA-associated protein 14 homolog A [Corythoichthys intestinalis]
MAKVSTKKRKIKTPKKSRSVPDVTPDVSYDYEDGIAEADDTIASEAEEDSDDERKRQKLVEAISSLGGTKRKKKLGERSEPAVQKSEFTINAEGEGVKVNLKDLTKSLHKMTAVSNNTKKMLKILQQNHKPVKCPLSKQESERIQRDVAFQKVATEVTQWKSVIQQNERAEQLVFPLNQEPSGPRTVERVVTSWKAKTPLEQEIFSLLSANKQPINDPILTPDEEASMKAMSLMEVKIRRAELQKARALQSYYEAKARRESKIKSKKYHKVLNKAKRKDFLKRFDKLVKEDPAAALEEMNKIELARMQERMSLKHQNSGKWAKSKAIMAKYDEGARKAMQQQLEVNKDLTQKLSVALDDDDQEAKTTETLPDFINEVPQGDDSNPWMRGKLSEEPNETGKESQDLVDLNAGSTGTTAIIEEEEESDVEETEEESLLREFDSRRKMRQAPDTLGNEDAEIMRESEDQLVVGQTAQMQNLEYMELLNQVESVQPSEVAVEPQPPSDRAAVKRKKGIQLKDVLTKEAKSILVPLAPTTASTEDADETLDQVGLIQEAFAGDDVISDFVKEKKKQEAADKPAVVDLTLPGWGEWSGKGLRPSRAKRKRFRVRPSPTAPRKDQNRPAVILSEKRNSSLSLHQVNSQPFPFTSPAQFESTLRSPVGRTWNTERTVKKLTQPKVLTQIGAIIEPMAREELVKDKKKSVTDASGVPLSRTNF